MAKYGKWVGLGLGWAFGGPIGGILGMVFGGMYDGMQGGTSPNRDSGIPYSQPGETSRQSGIHTRPGDFAASLVVLSAVVMKADGKVLKSELDFVKKFFYQQFGEQLAIENMLVLREVLKQDIKVDEVTAQIRHYMDAPARLQLLHFLFGISAADGYVHSSEVAEINRISIALGIVNREFESIKAMFYKDVYTSYKILEITRDANNDEVKKAYRKMAVKYHPDKVSHLGEEFRKAANEKFQKVNAAYEQIKKERGIK